MNCGCCILSLRFLWYWIPVFTRTTASVMNYELCAIENWEWRMTGSPKQHSCKLRIMGAASYRFAFYGTGSPSSRGRLRLLWIMNFVQLKLENWELIMTGSPKQLRCKLWVKELDPRSGRGWLLCYGLWISILPLIINAPLSDVLNFSVFILFGFKTHLNSFYSL